MKKKEDLLSQQQTMTTKSHQKASLGKKLVRPYLNKF
jgi:hypothetical protein